MSNQYNRYFRLGGRIGNNVDTVIESDGMTLIKNKYDPDNGNIPTSKGFTASDAIPHSSQNAYAAPKTYTYNTSNDFELGTAIPTTETYTNTVDDDTWYGSVKITKCTKSIDIAINAFRN